MVIHRNYTEFEGMNYSLCCIRLCNGVFEYSNFFAKFPFKTPLILLKKLKKKQKLGFNLDVYILGM